MPRLHRHALAATAFTYLLVLGAGCAVDDSEELAPDDQFDSATHPLVTPTSVCYGDNDYPADGGCFRGSALLSGSWTYVYSTSGGFWWGDARITTTAGGGWLAQWNYAPTRTAGNVYFSAWVPATNATTDQAYYEIWCGSDFLSYRKINQLYYSAAWVDLGHFDRVPAGRTCSVKVMKFLTTYEAEHGGSSTTKLAVDGMKMTIY